MIQTNKNPNSEHYRTVRDNVVQTCRAISEFKTDDSTIGANQERAILSFLKCAPARTVDVVPSLEALVGWAYVLDQDIYNHPQFMIAVWEEYHRRGLKRSHDAAEALMNECVQVLGIDLATFATLNITVATGSVEAMEMRDLLGMDRSTDGISGSHSFTNRQFELVVNDLTRPPSLQKVWNIVGQWFAPQESRPLIPETVDCVAMYLQNLRHVRNADRRDAIADGSYSEFQDDSVGQLNAFAQETIGYFQQQALTQYQASLNADAATEFVTTTDIFQAAGILRRKLTHFGDHKLRQFALAMAGLNQVYVSIRKRHFETNPVTSQMCPHFATKLQMLLTGTFTHEEQTVELYSPGWLTTGGPNRHWYRLWMEARRDQVSTEEWNAVLSAEYNIGGYWDELWTQPQQPQ